MRQGCGWGRFGVSDGSGLPGLRLHSQRATCPLPSPQSDRSRGSPVQFATNRAQRMTRDRTCLTGDLPDLSCFLATRAFPIRRAREQPTYERENTTAGGRQKVVFLHNLVRMFCIDGFVRSEPTISGAVARVLTFTARSGNPVSTA